ncbi:glycosyltransferase [Bordetella hinzii]|uniref:glycosyltransferase n=1 Tax=Bordetella hinzii TaxID=103855 RepID=UPI0006719356|nr:glycosyltransferase [Bordetella hinzii]AKQ57175.1 2-deoxystreptamine glucosyltransferase [Bordetella hinzii]SNV65407.1 glycosyltransferase [Bordetella hinzii]
MDSSRESPSFEPEAPSKGLLEELQRAHREEMQRLHMQYFERIRQAGADRLHAEDELDAMEERLLALDGEFREERAQLNAHLERLQAELLAGERLRSDLGTRLALAEAQCKLMEHQYNSLEARESEQSARHVETIKSLESRQQELNGHIQRLEMALEQARARGDFLEKEHVRLAQGLEALGTEHGERVAGLTALCERLELEKREFESRLGDEVARHAELRQRATEEAFSLAARVAQLDEALRQALDEKQRSEQLHAQLAHRAAELQVLCNRLEQEQSEQRVRAEVQRKDLQARLDAELQMYQSLAEAGRRELQERLHAEALRQAEMRLRHESEKRLLKERSAQLEQDSLAYRRAMVAAEQRLDARERKLGSRLGSALRSGLTSWRGFFSLPVSLCRAFGAPLQDPRRNADIWLAQIEELHASQGVVAAEDFVRRHALTPADLASGLTRLARAARDPQTGLPFAIEAAQVDPRPFRRKWLAFMYFDAGCVGAAHERLASLPDDIELKTSERNKAEYIAGCYRLLHEAFPLPEQAAGPDYSPVANRILYVAASSLPYHVSGYTLRTQGLLHALRGAGMDVLCVTRPGYPQDRLDGKPGLEPGRHEIEGVAYETLAGPHRRKLGLDEYLLRSADILAQKARTEQVAAIHAASNYESALPAMLAARKLGIPFFYEVRGLWEYTAASKRPGWEQSERFALESRLEGLTARHARAVFTLSGPLTEELVTRGVARDRIVLTPNAVDIEAFVPVARNAALAASLGLTEDDFIVGYVGSVVDYEGLADLIEALAVLALRMPRCKVLIVGDGDALQDIRRLAQTRGVDDRVILCGQVPPAQVRDYYALIDVLALPRRPERVCELVPPLKPLEAMALGIPLIVSDVAALRETVVDGQTALVHIAGNARSLADCIDMLAKRPELARQLADNARRDVEARRSWKTVAQTLLAVHGRSGMAVDAAWPSAAPAAIIEVDLVPIAVAAGKNALDAEGKVLLDRKLALALGRGVDVLRGYLARQCEGVSRRVAAYCRLRAAQACLDVGHEEEAMLLADAALAEDGSAAALRGAAKVLYNAARLDRAEELVRKMEAALGEVKPNDRKFIDEVVGRAQLAAWAGLPAQARTIPVSPKRVLNILAFSLPYTSVGYATRSHGLAIGIRNAGWEVRPYTRPGFPYDFKSELEGQDLPPQDDIDGVPYRRIFDFSRKGMNEVEYMLAAIEHYEHVIRAEAPEIVHAASNYVTALPALIAARRLGVPFVYEVRGFWEVTRSSRDDSFEHTAKYRYMQLFEGLTARHADHVITITTAMKEELMARGVPESNVSIAYNSVDPTRFVPRKAKRELADALGIPQGVPVIGYVGSFVDYEGLDDLVTACAGLQQAGRDFRLLLVGDGAVFESLRQQVEASGLQDKTIMTGRVPHDLVEDYYSLIDIAPFPRKPWEVCELVSPLKPYEAMALEKAVVVSGTRALREIVAHGENGLVFAKGNVKDLQRKLDELLVDTECRIRLGKDGRAWVNRERSWNVAGQICSDSYASVVYCGRA